MRRGITSAITIEDASLIELNAVQKGLSISHIKQVSINRMSVILRDTVPPIMEAAKLGYAVVAVYSLLYQSAYQDQRFDSRKYLKSQDRRDCGGTTNWSHKAIAETLGMGKAKVIDSINLLLENGFIQHEGFMQSSKESKHRIYRVVHLEMIDTVKAVMAILPQPPSDLIKRLGSRKSKN